MWKWRITDRQLVWLLVIIILEAETEHKILTAKYAYFYILESDIDYSNLHRQL